MWLAKVREQTGNPIEVDWQPFSLAQVNNKDGDNVWERPDVVSGEDPILLAHKAGLAIKRQGKEAFEAYFMALLKARHEDKADLNDQAVIDAAGDAAGIDMARFREDIADPSLLEELAESPHQGRGRVRRFRRPHLRLRQRQLRLPQDVHSPPMNRRSKSTTT